MYFVIKFFIQMTIMSAKSLFSSFFAVFFLTQIYIFAAEDHRKAVRRHSWSSLNVENNENDVGFLNRPPEEESFSDGDEETRSQVSLKIEIFPHTLCAAETYLICSTDRMCSL